VAARGRVGGGPRRPLTPVPGPLSAPPAGGSSRGDLERHHPTAGAIDTHTVTWTA